MTEENDELLNDEPVQLPFVIRTLVIHSSLGTSSFDIS